MSSVLKIAKALSSSAFHSFHSLTQENLLDLHRSAESVFNRKEDAKITEYVNKFEMTEELTKHIYANYEANTT